MAAHTWVRRRARVCVALIAIVGAPVIASEPLSIRVSPRMATEPATLVLSVFVERDPQNRGLTISVDSSGYSRNSFVELDGDAAPRVTSMQLSGVPGGSYEITATLYGPGGKHRGMAKNHVEILSRFGG
jgi:hypothetical protein